MTSTASSFRSTQSISYEKFAPRSTDQITRLSRLAALTAGPTAAPAAEAEESLTEEDTSKIQQSMAIPPPKQSTDSFNNNNNDANVSTTVSSTLKEASDISNAMGQKLKHVTSLRLALRASINIAEDISNRHAELLRHSSELSAAADRLQEEEAMLSRHATEIGMPLKHYDAVDRIGVVVGVLFKGKTVVRGLAKIKVDSEEFPKILNQIDEAVEFFGRESGGKEALQNALKSKDAILSGNIEYYRRALALQEAALHLIREAVADRISNTTQQVVATLNLTKQPVQADKLEASLIYTRFHGIASRSQRLIALVRERLHRGDAYFELLQACRHSFCSSREALLRSTVQSHMDKLKEEHGPVGMTRLASVFLIRLCTVETSLYLDFFGERKESSDKSVASHAVTDDGTYRDVEFQQYLTSLCSAFNRSVRRGLVTMQDLDTLCQIVSVLREEREIAQSSPTTHAAARAISSVIQDSQERLIYCANSTIQREVVRFKPKPDDLNYPDRLVRKEEESQGMKGDDSAMDHMDKVYDSWFPPVRSVIKILSKIFRVVETRVFEDMALQSVQNCTKQLRDGANYIRNRRGTLHSDLFLVKHLLILREQLSPFDIELRSIERQLDFSDAGKAVARFLANRNRRLFSMSTENALLTLLREGVSVQESPVDSKRDLEDALRTACNDFISHTAKTLADDLLSLIEACKSGDNKTTLLEAGSVESICTKVSSNLESSLDDISSQMNVYLDNPATQTILLKPVARQIARATEDLRKMIELCQDGEIGWTPDKRDAIGAALDEIDQAVKKGMKLARLNG